MFTGKHSQLLSASLGKCKTKDVAGIHKGLHALSGKSLKLHLCTLKNWVS